MDTCETPQCGKAATLCCPTCTKLGVGPSRYCTQECFKIHWPDHKKLHKLARQITTGSTSSGDCAAIPAGFSGYSYTGALRPATRSAKRTVPSRIARPDYADHPQGHSESEEGLKKGGGNSIPVYTAEEIKASKQRPQAPILGREVLDIAGRAVRPGVTTDEIDRVTHEACIERNCYPSPLNYYQFPKSVCTSVNEAICHGIPDNRELESGDICNIDVTVYHGGYHGDLNETFLVGKVDEESSKLVTTAYGCLRAAVDMVRPGTMYRDLGNVIGKHAREAGCSVVRTYCGHGIGSLFHTVPNIPHYPKNKAKGIMRPGHIFTIEPMINLGTWRDVTWPDNWTAVTGDGARSAQFEHTILVTEDGHELLTGRVELPNRSDMTLDVLETFTRP
ncbi:unnamed protein product [Chrysoparadoxa australica]